MCAENACQASWCEIDFCRDDTVTCWSLGFLCGTYIYYFKHATEKQKWNINKMYNPMVMGLTI